MRQKKEIRVDEFDIRPRRVNVFRCINRMRIISLSLYSDVHSTYDR